jgi:hypothetical protein
MRARVLLALVLAFAGLVSVVEAAEFQQRWVYVSQNLYVDKNIDTVIALMERSKQAGYTGMVLADSKFGRLPLMEKRYFDNVAKVVEAGHRLQFDIIPGIFPIGYSDSLLAQDVNLAAGVPVKGAPFVVKGGVAQPVMAEKTVLKNGDFEQVEANRFASYEFQDGIGQSSFADQQTVHEGKVSVRMENIGQVDPQHGHCRLMQTVEVEPFQYYHLSVWVKTNDFAAASEAKLMVLSNVVEAHNYLDLGVKRTQDWTQHHIVFNSLSATQVKIYLGVWGGKTGTIWWDDLRLEPGGLVNILRRDLCPLVVTNDDGSITYEETRDFEPVVDPKLGQKLWPGSYDPWHEAPAFKLTANSRIKEGQTLRLSYFHPMIIYGDQVGCSLEDPKVFTIMKDQMVRMHQMFHASGYFMSYDEIRVGGWEAMPDGRTLTSGEKLAEHVRKATQMVRETAPGAAVYVWSDMFDPTHNARDRYYLVEGTLKGAWEGLDPQVIIVNWNHGKRDESLKWFADRGAKQVIAGYYDGKPEGVRTWLESAAKVKDVTGIMYTTWQNKYADLEAYLDEVRQFKR